jgi:signal transduction histidine kinase
MTTPPIDSATPDAALALLARLTTLSRELAGAFRPSSVVELVARALTELLRPDRLSLVLLDVETNRLAVAYDSAPIPAVTDDPLLQLALRRGPLGFARDVGAEVARLGVRLGDAAPASWIGAPVVAAGRTIGAVSLTAERAGAFGEPERMITAAVVAQAAIALENARLVELLSSDKRRLQEQLLQSEKMSTIGQLIAGVAHDLNNPLASVVGFSDYLVEAGEIPPRLVEPLQVIRQEAERAATIVKNLLSFARRHEGARRRQPIKPILESALQLLANQLMASRIEATLRVEPGVPDVEVNANQITQVVVNLISNGAQAIAETGQGGRIWVNVRSWLDGVALSVTDSGPGIPDEVAAHVFEPFFTTKPEGKGTGLGLSICQGIVKEHGGRLTLESKPGAGATFMVELPRTTPAPPPEPAPEPAPPVRTLRILVVDDEPHILHYMSVTLESWGHTVEVASDGQYALERALAGAFDVIICDLRMPHLGGREMYDKLARQDPSTAERVIFATGDMVRGDTLRFLETLGRPYLRKPFTLAELRHVLDVAAKQPS